MYLVKGLCLPEAYHKAIYLLEHLGKEYPCPDYNTTMKELPMTIYVEQADAEPFISKLFPGGHHELQQYIMEICDGILDFMVGAAPNVWEYTYHQRFAHQLPWVINELKRNPYSRRAIMNIRDFDVDSGNDHPACFCAGTKVKTPDGDKKIEELKNGDLVYAYDFKNDKIIPKEIYNYFISMDNCVEVVSDFGSIKVSSDQLLYTKDGWKEAKKLKAGDRVLWGNIPSHNNHSLWHLIGCLYGDGWITSPNTMKSGSKRKCIGFSINPNADETLVYELFNSFTNNKIFATEKVVNSNVVKGNHVSKKYEFTDAELYDLLSEYIPHGKKITGKNVQLDIEKMSDDNIVDFLTGLFSSEGCIYFNDNRRPSIQLGMNWKECIDLVSDMLDRLRISHNIYKNKNTYNIRIDNLHDIGSFIYNKIDFRYDSRKQRKYYKLMAVYNKTISKKELSQNKKIEWQLIDTYCDDNRNSNTMFVPIIEIKQIGKKNIYDFTVDDENHAIITNGFVAHNCLQSIHFSIREDKLHMTVMMRSNDAVQATYMNSVGFISLQKKVAGELGVSVGSYTHIAYSFHAYESCFNRLKQYADAIATKDLEDLTYQYDSLYKDIMAQEVPSIMAMVNEQKKKYGV